MSSSCTPILVGEKGREREGEGKGEERGREREREGGEERVITSLEAESLICATLS